MKHFNRWGLMPLALALLAMLNGNAVAQRLESPPPLKVGTVITIDTKGGVVVRTVASVTGDTVSYTQKFPDGHPGMVVATVAGNIVRGEKDGKELGSYKPYYPFVRYPLAVGQKWQEDFTSYTGQSFTVSHLVEKMEAIRLGNGKSVNAFKIALTHVRKSDARTDQETVWVGIDTGLIVKYFSTAFDVDTLVRSIEEPGANLEGGSRG